jgi:molybdate transport system substrate-binding protein
LGRSFTNSRGQAPRHSLGAATSPRSARLAPWLIVCCLAGCSKPKEAPQPLRVAAAADLARAFEAVGVEFVKENPGPPPIFTFGSTGLLAKQVIQGAPFDLFAAANVSFADDVLKAGACDATSKALYARGRIVAWSTKKAPADLKDLAKPEYVKIAIANPEHAPYGRAAVEALTSAGVYEQVKPKLVFGENVQQTLQFAQSGNAEVAIVALSLAIVSDGAYLQIPPELHKPIDQALLVCSKRPEAARFAQFVNSPTGRGIMRRFGFLLPGEVVANNK